MAPTPNPMHDPAASNLGQLKTVSPTSINPAEHAANATIADRAVSDGAYVTCMPASQASMAMKCMAQIAPSPIAAPAMATAAVFCGGVVANGMATANCSDV